jgi:hypothetical protein
MPIAGGKPRTRVTQRYSVKVDLREALQRIFNIETSFVQSDVAKSTGQNHI